MAKKQKFLVLKGMCGLGNRIMCLANAIEYCKRTERTLYVDWTDGMFAPEGVNAFSLFLELEGVSLVYEPDQIEGNSYYPEYAKQLPINFKLLDYFECYHYHDCKKIFQYMIDIGSSVVHKFGTKDLFRRYFVWWWHWYARDKKVRKHLQHHWGDIITFGENLPYHRKEDVVFYVDLAPSYPEENVKQYIRLSPEIQQEVEEFTVQHQLNKQTLGIHVRDTDKQNDISCQDLIRIVKDIMSQQELHQVFLATDQKRIQEAFSMEFGKQLVVYEKYIPSIESGGSLGIHLWAEQYGDSDLKVQMFHDSIMDMWLLSETTYLLFQGNSTFSKISSDLKDGKNCQDWQKLVEKGKLNDERY